MRTEEKRLVDVKEEVKSEDNKLKQVVKHFVKSLFIQFFQLKKQMVESMAERERLDRQVEETLIISTIIILFGNLCLSNFRRQKITNIFLGGGKEGGGFPR